MGSAYRFECEDCGLMAEVSGGPDAGFVVETNTVWCAACSTLQDVTIRKDRANSIFDSGNQEDWVRVEQVCVKCKGGELETWKAGDPCPRCTGVILKSREIVEFWD